MQDRGRQGVRYRADARFFCELGRSLATGDT